MNFSVQKLALLSAIVIIFPLAILLVLVMPYWQTATVVSLAFLIGVFLFIRYMLNRFVERKIKIIHKLIHKTKISEKEKVYYKYLLPPKSLEEVETSVAEWALQTSKEIEMLQTNDAYRREFLQNFSHEIKTPLFSIYSYVETLLDGALYDESVNKKFLEHTAHNVSRMVDLMKDLDEITLLENKNQNIKFESFIIQNLIEEVYESAGFKQQYDTVYFTIKKTCKTPIYVYADKQKIGRVIVNLIANAIRYSKPGSAVLAGVYVTDGRHVLVEISDSGMGIAETDLQRIFERFYRTDAARSKHPNGSGLGLAICKHIIESHGQKMHVRSTLSHGTTVGFTLKKG